MTIAAIQELSQGQGHKTESETSLIAELTEGTLIMLILDYSSQFKKDFKKITKMPIPDIIDIGNIILFLVTGTVSEIAILNLI